MIALPHTLLCILTGNQFSAIFIQVKTLCSSPSDADVDGLAAALKSLAAGAGAGLKGIPFVTMVMLVGPGEKEDPGKRNKKSWSVDSDNNGSIHVVLRGLTPCNRFIPPAVQRTLHSCCWNISEEVRHHFESEVNLTEENAILAAEGMKSTCF